MRAASTAAEGMRVSINYTGSLEDGTVFDSSYDRNQEFSFRIGMGKVIKGWDEAVANMSLGERALIFVPACKAYGAQGSPPAVPPSADLKFEVHLLKIERAVQRDGRKHHEYEKVAKGLLGQSGHHAADS